MEDGATRGQATAGPLYPVRGLVEAEQTILGVSEIEKVGGFGGCLA